MLDMFSVQLRAIQLVEKSPVLEPESSSPSSQKHTTEPHPETV